MAIMTMELAIAMFEEMVRGSNPLTGDAIEDDAILSDANVIRALNMALLTMQQSYFSRKSNKQPKPPPPPELANSGKKYTPEDDSDMLSLFLAREPIITIARKHKRTAGAICERLMTLGAMSQERYEMERNAIYSNYRRVT